jgi:hypothetical protein
MADSNRGTVPGSMNARVFVSCGQNRESNELETARSIAARLASLGFIPYVASEEQTLRGLKDNIFARLAASEYFVFVDLKRERFKDTDECRGSLFSHQELAIASYLDIEVLAFQEAGVKQLDGIMAFLQANVIPFTDRHLLPNVIADKVAERGWKPNWRRALEIKRDPDQQKDANIGTTTRIYRYVHASVHNHRRARAAVHTYGYLDRITNLADDADLPLRTVELKWAGFVFPNALIRAGGYREIDCCWIDHATPSVARFSSFADSPDYEPLIKGPGRYRLHYTVIADGFGAAHAELELVLGTQIQDATLLQISNGEVA